MRVYESSPAQVRIREIRASPEYRELQAWVERRKQPREGTNN